jgi:hypothetical protein
MIVSGVDRTICNAVLVVDDLFGIRSPLDDDVINEYDNGEFANDCTLAILADVDENEVILLLSIVVGVACKENARGELFPSVYPGSSLTVSSSSSSSSFLILPLLNDMFLISLPTICVNCCLLLLFGSDTDAE